MSSRKIRERQFFIREEWPFPDKGISINHHVHIYMYIFIYLNVYLFFISLYMYVCIIFVYGIYTLKHLCIYIYTYYTLGQQFH